MTNGSDRLFIKLLKRILPSRPPRLDIFVIPMLRIENYHRDVGVNCGAILQPHQVRCLIDLLP
jgi:hypothetical protein